MNILMFARMYTRRMLDIGREFLAKGRRPDCLRATFGLSLSMAVVAVSLITPWPAFGQNTTVPLFLQVGSKLVATGGASLAAQGAAVAISADGSTILVGALIDGGGSAAVFTKTAGAWTQQARLVGSGGSPGRILFGYSVALSADGNTAAVGATKDGALAGAVWVFARSGNTWTQQGNKLVGTGAVGPASQGASVALSADGNTLMEGGQSDSNGVGAVWVFTRSSGAWTQQGAKIVGTGNIGSANEGNALSLSSSGDIAIVGGFGDAQVGNGNAAGAAWIFTRSGGTWTQQSKLLGSGAAGLAKQGFSVAISADGNTAILGGYFDNANAGAAWIFTQSGGVWSQQGGKLTPTDGAPPSVFGASSALSADGNSAIIGGFQDNGLNGAAWVFTRSAGVWSQRGSKLLATDAVGAAAQGYSVSLSGDGTTAVAGGPQDNNAQGAAWVYSTRSNFGALPVGTTITATIGVQFATPFTLASIRPLTTGTANLDYTLAATQPSSNACLVGTGYSAGNTCLINVTFTPSAPGARPGAIVIMSNASATIPVATIYLTGVGLAPQFGFVSGVISTVAGNGTPGYTGDGGPATSAQLNNPDGLTGDSSGNVFIADLLNNRLRRVDAVTGIISTVAGNGTAASNGDSGPATSAGLLSPTAVVVDGAGNLFIAQDDGHVREVFALSGQITTVAGGNGTGYSGDGGPATLAQVGRPSGIAVDASGNIYISDSLNEVIRKVDGTTGIITTIAGAAKSGYSGDGGSALLAKLHSPGPVTFDSANNFYICDASNDVVRRIDALTGIITTVAGNGTTGYSGDGGLATSAELSSPAGIAVDSGGNLYIADGNNNALRKVNGSTGIITTIAGNINFGYSGDGGAATKALLDTPVSTFFDGSGNLFFVDEFNRAIRKITGVAPLTYGSSSVDASSAQQDVEVSNTGNATLTLTSVTASTNFNLTGADTTCAKGANLAGGASCVIGVIFAPTDGGPLSGTVSFVADATAPQVPLSGTGVALPTTTTLQASPNPAIAGDAVTLTATVTPTPIGASLGTVSFFDGATLLGTVNVIGNNSAATATFDTTTRPVGTHSLTATYSGNAGFTTSTSSPASLVVNIATGTVTTTALTIAPNPAAFGQSVTFTATITPSPTGSPIGIVTFLNGGIPIGTATPNASGVATFTSTSIPVGTYSLTANYGGTTGFQPSTSSPAASFTVNKASTTIALAMSPNPSAFGQTVTLTATVTVTAPGVGPAAGSVTFLNGTTTLGSANLNGSGVATFPSETLPSGVLSLTAVYAGNASFLTSTSSAQSLTVTTPTATVLTATPRPSTFGQSVSLTATTSPAPTGAPLGMVNFFNGATVLGSSSVGASGAATLSITTLPAGTLSLTAVYSGNSAFGTSTSAPLIFTVDDAITAVALTVSPSPATFGQTVTLTATISPAPTDSPTGTVIFVFGGSTLGTITPNSSGVATFTTSSLPAGTGSLTASYSGDADFAPANSSAFSLTVNTTYMVTTSVQTPIAVPEAGTAMIPVNVPPEGGPFNNAVTMSVTGLPPGATGTFVPPTVMPGSTGAATVLTVQLLPLAAGNYKVPSAPGSPGPLLAVAVVLLALTRRKDLRRSLRLAAIFLALTLFGSTLIGCNGGFLRPPSTTPGAFALKIAGTSGTTVQTTTVTLEVQ